MWMSNVDVKYLMTKVEATSKRLGIRLGQIEAEVSSLRNSNNEKAQRGQ